MEKQVTQGLKDLEVELEQEGQQVNEENLVRRAGKGQKATKVPVVRVGQQEELVALDQLALPGQRVQMVNVVIKESGAPLVKKDLKESKVGLEKEGILAH